jgi:hypothetical protein
MATIRHWTKQNQKKLTNLHSSSISQCHLKKVGSGNPRHKTNGKAEPPKTVSENKIIHSSLNKLETLVVLNNDFIKGTPIINFG